MKRIFFLFSVLLLSISLNAQRYFHYQHTYPRGRVVYVEPYYEKEVIVIEKQQKRQPIVVNNNYVYVNKEKENDKCDDEYITLDYNIQKNKEKKFDYNDMWSQTIWFKTDSYKKIRTDGKIALDNVYNFLIEHDDAKIILYGYASRKYGTYNYNKHLAENRVRTVSNYLVNVYQIDWSRIEMRVIGTDYAEYETDKWNQCVVIKCER